MSLISFAFLPDFLRVFFRLASFSLFCEDNESSAKEQFMMDTAFISKICLAESLDGVVMFGRRSAILGLNF